MSKIHFFILLITLYGCGTDTIESNLEVISVDIDNSGTLLLSELFERIDYIPLKSSTRYSSIFNDWMDIKMFNDELYIYQDGDTYGNIFRFNKEGTNTHNYFFPSEGPGKIINGSDYTVDEEEGLIRVVDVVSSSVVNFGLSSGKYVDKNKLPALFSKIHCFDKTCIFFKRNVVENQSDQNFNLYRTDRNFNVQDSSMKIPPYLANLRIKEYNFSNERQNKVLFKNILNDTIYEFSDEKIRPKYRIDLGDRWISQSVYNELSVDNGRENRRKLLYNNNEHIYDFVNLFDAEHKLYLTTFYKGNFHWIIYDKKSKLAKSYNRLKNDIDGGLIGNAEYWPRVFNNGNIYYFLPTEDIAADIEYKNSRDLASSYRSLLNYNTICDGILAVCKVK